MTSGKPTNLNNWDAFLNHKRISRDLATEARGMHAVALNATLNPAFGEYAERRRAICQRHYEAMGVALAALASEAQDEADAEMELIVAEQTSALSDRS